MVSLVAAAAAPSACRASGQQVYVPRVRDLTITAAPLLTKELARVYPFLVRDFAPGGILEGKEVYGFTPSTLVAYEGDTLRFTLLNPEDDEHTFVLPGLAVLLHGQSVTHATYVARDVGVLTFVCNLPAHVPTMYGELVVLPAAAAPAGR